MLASPPQKVGQNLQQFFLFSNLQLIYYFPEKFIYPVIFVAFICGIAPVQKRCGEKRHVIYSMYSGAIALLLILGCGHDIAGKFKKSGKAENGMN